MSVLSDLRNPNKTIILADLEKEYGVSSSPLLTEATRRQRLAQLVFGGESDGTEDDLQTALREAGFNDIYVYQNDPAVDPAQFLEQVFQMVAGGDNAYAGRPDAFAGILGGELLVNGDIFKTRKIYTSGAGSGLYAGAGHGAGEYQDVITEKIEYPIPTDPGDWPLVFFVGGVATYGFIELLLNGGFEQGSFVGWFQNGATLDNTNPATGTWCAKLDAVGVDLKGAETESQDVSPLRKYTLKAKNDITAYAAGNYKNILEFRDGDDILISSFTLLNKTAVTVGYEQLEKTFGPADSGSDIVMPITARKVRFYHTADNTPTLTAFLDDVELYRSDKQAITNIALANVDIARQDEFKRIILQYKGLHAWAALIVNFI